GRVKPRHVNFCQSFPARAPVTILHPAVKPLYNLVNSFVGFVSSGQVVQFGQERHDLCHIRKPSVLSPARGSPRTGQLGRQARVSEPRAGSRTIRVHLPARRRLGLYRRPNSKSKDVQGAAWQIWLIRYEAITHSTSPSRTISVAKPASSS